jgi:hypothetical protein
VLAFPDCYEDMADEDGTRAEFSIGIQGMGARHELRCTCWTMTSSMLCLLIFLDDIPTLPLNLDHYLLERVQDSLESEGLNLALSYAELN